MEIIDRYVHEVGNRLPRRTRADVEAELRSLLTETLDDRARAAGRPADAALAEQVIKEFGAPRDVASRYAGEQQYLIGPRLFPAYLLTLKIAAIGLGVVFALLVIARLAAPVRGDGSPSGALALFRIGSRIFHSALYNLGLLTLIFAIVERVLAQREDAGTEWDPATLPPVDDPDRISVIGKIFSTYAIVALVVLFNFFPQWVGVWGWNDGQWRGLSVLLPGFSVHLPLLNSWWASAFALNLIVIRHGRFTRGTRWAELALGLFGIVVLLVIMLGPQVFLFDRAAKSVLAVPLLIAAIATGVRLYRLLTRRPAEPWTS